MAELTKRFIKTTAANWANVEDKNVYNNSIVFIKSDDGTKGVKIYTQGVEFNTELNSDAVEIIINDYIKGSGNITVEVAWVKDNTDVSENTEGATPELRISDKSTDNIAGLYTLTPDKKTATLKEDADDSQLVQVKAVAEALTIPVTTTLSVENGIATFTESFQNLKGETKTAVGSVLKAGNNVAFESDTNPAGLKISATDTTYTLGVEPNAETDPNGVKVNLTSSTELDDDDQALV